MKHSLEELKASPELRGAYVRHLVYIYSGEWGTWWRQGGSGYTNVRDEAGIFDFGDALARTRHCDPEKRIMFETVKHIGEGR